MCVHRSNLSGVPFRIRQIFPCLTFEILGNRIIRQRIFDCANNRSLLNLFCYTGSVGLQAVLGGASFVLNVDLSATYLKWARENHAINQLEDESSYQFLGADVVELLENPSRFGIDRHLDLIFLDPL